MFVISQAHRVRLLLRRIMEWYLRRWGREKTGSRFSTATWLDGSNAHCFGVFNIAIPEFLHTSLHISFSCIQGRENCRTVRGRLRKNNEALQKKSNKKSHSYRKSGFSICGGERGIRTLGGVYHTHLAGEHHRPTRSSLLSLAEQERIVIVAEEVGFEPTVLSYNGFQDRRLQPLGHSS